MRSFVKKIASVLAAVFVISSLSMMVSANTLVGSGTVTPQYSGSFDWEYYSNNLLKLYPTDIRININKNDFPSGYLTDETTVYIDLSYVQSLDYDDLRYFVFYGSNCPSGNIIVGGENVSQFDDFSFYDFSYLEEIYFDDDVSLQWLGLFNCGNFSIDIFDQAEINELYVSDCNNLYGIRVPDYIECLQLNDCYCVTGIEISENLDKYDLGVAVSKLYDFIWDYLCDWYIELAKIRFNADEKSAKTVREVIIHVMSETMKLLEEGMADTLVVDPPRTGLDERLLKVINDSSLENIIYVSCNPSTLAKNIARLKNFRIERVIPLDMFPQTANVEAIVKLTRKKR